MSIVGKMWRGDVPLWQACWIYGVLGKVLLSLALSVATLLSKIYPLVGLLIIPLFVFQACYNVVVFISIWKSSYKYEGNPLWASLARVMIIAASILYVNFASQVIRAFLSHI